MISRRALLVGAGAAAGAAILPAPAEPAGWPTPIYPPGLPKFTTIGLLDPDNGIRWVGQWSRFLTEEEVHAICTFMRGHLEISHMDEAVFYRASEQAGLEPAEANGVLFRLADGGFSNRLESASLKVIE